MFGLGFGYGMMWYNIHAKSLKWELLIARPIKHWRRWFNGFSRDHYKNMGMKVTRFSGFEFRQYVKE